MNADVKRIRANELSSKVIECAFRVSNVLGSGFLEKVYENVLAVEFRRSRLEFKRQRSYQVCYLDEVVGEYIPDFVVDDTVIVEIKAYLHATKLSVGLLLNFGTPRVEVKRIVLRF